MSVKVGAKFVAGNLALKVQDRLFYAKEVMENGKEYYDVIVPEGASLGFTQATKLALIIQGTNKTTTPILRYKSNEFQIVGGSFNATAPIKLGELRDGGLAEMYMGTSMKHIYLAANENSYDQIRNTPIFVDREGDQIPLLGGPVNYDTLHLPYLKNKVLVLDSEDFLKITTAGFEYGWQDYTKHHTFLSGDRLEWKKSVNEVYELATTKDIEQLVIGNVSRGVLTYGRKTQVEMEAIEDMDINDTCLCIEDTTIYKYDGAAWVVKTKLEWGQEQNGWFYEVEDCDGTHSGRAIWNWIEEHGQFETFIDYVNGIDNYSITRNSDGSMQVARLLHTLKLKVSIPGMVTKEITFDGLEDKVLEINTTLSDYYTKTEIDSYYNDNTAGRLVEFYQEGSNVKLHNLDITKANLVLDMGSGYLKANNIDIDASRIKYTKSGVTSSVKTFLDKNFAFYDVVNDFIPGQTIDGKLIATEDWVEDYADNTFMPNKFNLELLTNLQLVLDAPSATKTSLRFSTINLNTGDREDNDIELPVVNAHNNGLVTPDQMNLWDTVTTKTPLVNTQGQLESAIHYQDNTPRVTTTTATQKAGLEIVNGEELLEIDLLATQNSSGHYSGIVTDKNGAYVFQDEAVGKDAAHLIVNRGYLENNAVMQNSIQQLDTWSKDRVVINDLDIINITATGAVIQLKGSSVTKKTSGTVTKALPIVTSTKAGLATASMYNQIESNRVAIAALNGQGSVGAHIGLQPTQEDIQGAWDAGKPGIKALEGANVINLTTGDTWRLMSVDGGELQWVNLGVLGGNAIASTQNAGIVLSTEDTEGMIMVETDGKMSLVGWDRITSDITDLDLDLGNLQEKFNNHISDVETSNVYPHVSTADRTKWNNGVTTANNAIPKVTAAVNNNIAQWSTAGVIKDSGKNFVTTLASPTDNGIPTAKAVDSAITGAINTEVTNRNSAITTAINTEVTNRNAAIKTSVDAEAKARDAAITTAINTEVTNRNAAIKTSVDAEAKARDAAINTYGKPKVTATLTLDGNGWSSNQKTVTISGYNSALLNTIVVDPASVQAWANFGINAIAETTTGITFRCSQVPNVTLNYKIVSEYLAT